MTLFPKMPANKRNGIIERYYNTSDVYKNYVAPKLNCSS